VTRDQRTKVAERLDVGGPDAIVGELSMMDGRPRSACVVAIADCSLSFVSQAKF